MRHQKGFTLIELLIVIAIIGILAAVVIIAVNPGRQLAQANDARRSSEVNAVLNALGQYGADFAGANPPGLGTFVWDATTSGNVQVVMDDVNAACETGLLCPGGTGRPVTLSATAPCIDLSDPDNPQPSGLDNDLTPTYLTTIPRDPQAAATGGTSETQYYVDRDSGTRRVTVGACIPQIQSFIEVTR